MGLALLEDWMAIEDALLDNPDGLTHGEISRITGIPESSLTRRLATMSDGRRIELRPDGRWLPAIAWSRAPRPSLPQEDDRCPG